MDQLRSDTLVMAGNEGITDTAVVVDGKAVFEGARINTPQHVTITAQDKNPQRLVKIFLENGASSVNIKFSGSGRAEIYIKGGTYQTFADSLETVRKTLLKKYNIDSLIAAGAGRPVLFKIYDTVNKAVDKLAKDYIESDPTSLYALDKLYGNLDKITIAEAGAKLAAFKALPEYTSNKTVAKVEEIVNILKALEPGKTAPDFVQYDNHGNAVRFSDFYRKNKVTMLDFWSSKCSPCRAFNPTLSKIYKKYKDRGFDIIAVSLDKNKESWLKAIEEDNVEWLQVSDLQGWNSEVAKKYHVRAIPQSVFVDQEGKIIKRKPSHTEIEELLRSNL